jgi:hypothetical protein
MHILVTGGTGFLGQPLVAALAAAGHNLTVLSRSPGTVSRLCGPGVHALASLDAWRPDTVFDAVINLAGAPIVDRRWTEARKRALLDSRIALTGALVRRIAAAAHKPAVLLSGSAVGIYGDTGDAPLDESAPAGSDFAAQLCAGWENAASLASASGTRVCLLRTGLVLHPSGGLLGRMLLPFKLGLGGRLGNGRQWMSWIHRDDWIALVLRFLSDPSAHGAFNLTAPEPVTNAAFTAALGRTLRRPTLFPAPAPVLRALLGERAQMLLTGQRALPKHADELEFRFAYPELSVALSNLLR